MPTMKAGSTLSQSDLPGFPVRRGKVRDIYDLGDALLLVATDRISTYDVVHPTPIPDKGRILTALSLFWFDLLKDVTSNHLIATDPARYGRGLEKFADQLTGRSMLVRKATVVPIECVVRGYLAGSGWKDYQSTGAVCGIKLPPGMKQCQKLETPAFTPSTKADVGHDENISYDQAAQTVGDAVMKELRDRTLAIYKKAADYAAGRGILIADTKFEFGRHEGKLLLIDEVLTPDSSRFWPADKYAAGRDQESFDKQFVRNYVTGLGWNKQPPAPEIAPDIVEKTRAKYIEAYEKLTGRKFA
jgi:phosphoribosylaminoimidazole-succinocarboxamide synthase